jgi:predicted amidohydrolase
MPGDGVVALSGALSPQSSQWLVCQVDLQEVRRVRREGQVFTRRDWPEQFERLM